MSTAPLRLGFPVKVMGRTDLKSNDTRRWQPGLFNALVLGRVSPKWHALMQTAP